MLSDRYISDRFLPDKAIDLMDEASAKARVALWSVQKTVGLMHATIISRYHQVKMEVTSKPAELERLDRKILQHLNCNLGPLSLVVFPVFHRFSISGEMLLKSVHVRLEMERLSVGEDKEGFLKFAESIQKTPQPSANECGRNTH